MQQKFKPIARMSGLLRLGSKLLQGPRKKA